jgi:hypothetical protein
VRQPVDVLTRLHVDFGGDVGRWGGIGSPGSKVAIVLYFRRPREQVAGNLENQPLCRRHCWSAGAQPTMVDETTVPRGQASTSGPLRTRYFSDWVRRILRWGTEAWPGRKRSSSRPEARGSRAGERERRERKLIHRGVEKAAGPRPYTQQRLRAGRWDQLRRHAGRGGR